MKRNKIKRIHDKTVIYTPDKWKIFYRKRKRAQFLLKIFRKHNLNPYVYGSIARGDVNENSDIDIVFLHRIPLFKIEYILNENNIFNYQREILMATPNDSLKFYIHLNDLESITVPITKLNTSSIEFYDFGGKINYTQIKNKIRVNGVDKRLVFIQPIEKGHKEVALINSENLIAKRLNISLSTINERKKVLLRREKYGKTGVFIKRELSIHDTPEGILKELSKENSFVRKKLASL